ncbi:hypothetical protein V1512DRAFT_266222 [Lipomyces arxii]|uniref:uncharacterized protein n=1 Tax=Lipomyces arxii TaxID=56418 RepID=UPI0034CEF242
MSFKRRHFEDFGQTAESECNTTSSVPEYEEGSRSQTPELVFSSKRRCDEYPFNDSHDSDSSPDDASDLFEDLFTPLLSALNTGASVFGDDKVDGEESEQIKLRDDDEGFTTDEDEEIPVSGKRPAAGKMVPASLDTAHQLPLGFQPMGPPVGHWSEKSKLKVPDFHSTRSLLARECLPMTSSVLPTQYRKLSTAQVSMQPQSNVDALLEQYLDVNRAVDHSVSPENAKSWIDRYTTIPICGYLNRANTEKENDVAVAATSVAGVCKPTEVSLLQKGRPSAIKRAASIPSVVGLKRRALSTGKGREMVGLGVIVGDLLL